MSKTAAIILNHNLPVWTDRLYKSLKPYERDDYELMVFDNGSKEENVSEHTTFRSEENLYFGGGFHAGMQVVLEDEQYDSMLFLNNDLTVFGYNFVRTLREAMFREVADGYGLYGAPRGLAPINTKIEIIHDIVSPCFYNIEPEGQCHWKTMHNWGSNIPREVSFIDFQCPLISRRLLKEVDQIDADLMYGWGVDTYLAILCKKKGWEMAVLDYVSVLHHNSLTVKLGVANLSMADYCKNAEIGQYNFFSKNNLMKEYHEVRNAGTNYSFSK
jgi:GT2 family glycosyltransferase